MSSPQFEVAFGYIADVVGLSFRAPSRRCRMAPNTLDARSLHHLVECAG